MNSKKVIFVVGPTASGKSQLALDWAMKMNGVIVNCDSVQVYRHLKIGSAQPSDEEKKQVQHLLYDYVSPPDEMTAGNYARDFFKTIDQIKHDGPIFVVGGTGFYFLAIEKGMYPIPKIPEEVRKQIELELQTEEGKLKLYKELETKDPESAQKIHYSDNYRIGRAMEVIRSMGKSMTQIKSEFEASQKKFPYPLLKVGIWKENEELKNNINLRVEKMLQAGLIDEVKGLLDLGLETWAPMASVGYKETILFLKNELGLEKLKESITQNTYQLAKRQKTWFQRDRDIQWAKSQHDFLKLEVQVDKFLRAHF